MATVSDAPPVKKQPTSTSEQDSWNFDDPSLNTDLEFTSIAKGKQATGEPAAERRQRVEHGLAWGNVIWLSLIHAATVAAIFTFTWEALVLTIFLHWLTGGIGICLGYHRLLTHGSFKTYRPVRLFFATLGGLAGEGSAVDWVANHRKHHACSDQEGDPHSPLDGAWWSHVFWIAWSDKGQVHTKHIQRWAPDLVKDPSMILLDRLFLPLHFGFGTILGLLGFWLGGWPMTASFVLWGLFARLAFVMHSTWLVNSASHIWGYRNYATADDSRNNWWVALLTYGEGWHNNHHAYPRMAKHGHQWWEIDTTFWVVRLLQSCGLAWKVVDYKQRTKVT